MPAQMPAERRSSALPHLSSLQAIKVSMAITQGCRQMAPG